MEKQRQNFKEFLTTWERPHDKKSSQLLPSCDIATRLAVLQNFFAITLLWARKDIENVFEETAYKYYRRKAFGTKKKMPKLPQIL